jgi:Ras-related protein Rab-5C
LCKIFPRFTCWQNSFDKAKDWVKELQQQGDPNVVVAFVGNKVDMENQRKVTTEVTFLFIAD